MSAWVVSHEHVWFLVEAMERLSRSWSLPPPPVELAPEKAATRPNFNGYSRPYLDLLEHATLHAIARRLLAECRKSVAYRYPDHTDNLPGYQQGDLPLHVRLPQHMTRLLADPIAILVDCYCYQSCEHPGWETSPVKEAMDDLGRAAARSHKDYDRAPWDPTEEPAKVAAGGAR